MSDGAVKAPHYWCQEMGKRADIVQVSTQETPPCDELFANTVNCGTAGDTYPEEIVIDDIHAPRCNETYTTVKLPASISGKGTASLHVKVNTRAGGNVLPLCVFQCLHLNWISPAGLPTGLDHVSTCSPPTMDPIYPCMANCMGPLSGSQTALAFNLTRSIHIGTLQTPLVLPS